MGETIYDIVRRSGDHPLIAHDMHAYQEALALGQTELANRILEDARVATANINAGHLSRPQAEVIEDDHMVSTRHPNGEITLQIKH